MYLKRLVPLYTGAAIGPMGGIGILPLIPVLAGKWSVECTTASLAITLYLVPFIIIRVFSGYALAPVVLAVLYAPFGLQAVQWGCMGAVFVPSTLAVVGDRRARSRPSYGRAAEEESRPRGGVHKAPPRKGA